VALAELRALLVRAREATVAMAAERDKARDVACLCSGRRKTCAGRRSVL
jgi:hypothetical protein